MKGGEKDMLYCGFCLECFEDDELEAILSERDKLDEFVLACFECRGEA